MFTPDSLSAAEAIQAPPQLRQDAALQFRRQLWVTPLVAVGAGLLAFAGVMTVGWVIDGFVTPVDE